MDTLVLSPDVPFAHFLVHTLLVKLVGGRGLDGRVGFYCDSYTVQRYSN